MMNWAKQTLANVAGTKEPIYGSAAIRSVAAQAETTPFTELTREHMKWEVLESTAVATASFYLMSDSGHLALVQIIYSNVMGIHTTSQFVTKIFYPGAKQPPLWSSDQLSHVDISEDRVNFYAENCALELSEDGKTYTIKSATNLASVVNITVTQTAPGFQVGKDGKSYYGTDPKHPWGAMRHAFWPRNKVEGTIVTKDGAIDFKGKAMLSFALQGMKPHHAAARWKFANFQGPQHSAVLMEFVTPPSYGSTTVAVGGIAKDGEIITAGAGHHGTFLKSKNPEHGEWPEPEEVKFEWSGKSKDGKAVSAVLEGALDKRLDRIDVMAEVPGFVKTIVAAAAGTKPYIYQYSPTANPLTLKLKVGDEEVSETGWLFSEATFISE